MSMSAIFQVLPFVGAVLGVVATVYAVLTTARQHKAESNLRHSLLRAPDYQAFLRTQRNLLVHAQEHSMSEDEIALLVPLISEELQYLEEQDRARIKEALYQPSLRGRYDYISKLVT
jgi:hypothetical protein